MSAFDASSSEGPRLVFHYAVARNGVIGKDNAMPWQLSSDLKRFKALTMGKPIIMGRKTFESIGRPLPGRTNIVVSRDAAYHADGVIVVHTVEQALERGLHQAAKDGVDEVAVIGGGAIYNALWDRADRLYVTHVHADPDGDTYVPAIDLDVWQETEKTPPLQGERDSAPIHYSVYDRL